MNETRPTDLKRSVEQRMRASRLLSSRALTVLAIVLWGSSLAFVALALYAGERKVYGAEVLATGWLALLGLNVAWFANPLFLVSAARLLLGKSAVTLSILAAVVSLDTVRFKTYLLDEGGATTQVYGYGWGAVLWFLSLAVNVAAAGTRQVELSRAAESDSKVDEWLRPLGFTALLVVVLLAGYLAIGDRLKANERELQRLHNLAFKRGAVCNVEDMALGISIPKLEGPLELQIDSAYSSLAYPLDRPTELLKWGVPAVRVGQRDYFFEQTTAGAVLASLPASGISPATLRIDLSSNPLTIVATLTDNVAKRIVFERTWRSEGSGSRFCPDYSMSGKTDVEPGKLVVAALGLPSTSNPPAVAPDGWLIADKHRVVAEVSKKNEKQSRDTRGDVARPARYGGGASPRPWRDNRNCPADVGWDGSEKNRASGMKWAFKVGEKAYYIEMSPGSGAWCDENSVYLYQGTASGGRYHLFLQRRTLPDFELKWVAIVGVHDNQLATRDNVLKVTGVRETSNSIFVDAFHDDDGTVATLLAPITAGR